MGTEVLRPQQDFFDRFQTQTAPFHYRRNFQARNLTTLNVDRRPASANRISPRNERRKSPAAKKPSRNDEAITRPVNLLRRGASLDSFSSDLKNGNPVTKSYPIDDLNVRNGSGSQSPDMGLKKIRMPPSCVYAGSAVSTSPSPRSVPVPSFFNKNKSDDSASKDLRRMLNLE